MFGHCNVFFPPGLPADEMLLLDRFFQLTLNNGEETAEDASRLSGSSIEAWRWSR